MSMAACTRNRAPPIGQRRQGVQQPLFADDALAAPRQHRRDGIAQRRYMSPIAVERHLPIGSDEIGRIGKQSVLRVHAAIDIVDQHLPWNGFLAHEPEGVVALLLSVAVGRHRRPGMPLAHKYVHEAHVATDVGVQVLERLDRAGGERSGVRREAQQHRTIAMSAEREQIAANGGQREVWRH